VPTVVFKDLCLDATDAFRIAAFWGSLLGLDVARLDDGDAVLRRDGTAVLWVNRVPEPKTVKNRVHLDVGGDAPPDATLLHDEGGFRVLEDPEGNEFCAFPDSAPGVLAICTDSPRPEAVAAWWAALVGGKVGPGPDGTPRWIHGAAGLKGVTWKFLPVDDERVVKNRCHWDVYGDPAELVAAGATVVRERDDETGWTVLADPDGNEFCAFPR
jgi:Glyoxalase-like domain